MQGLHALEQAYSRLRDDESFKADLDALLRNYVGRPTPLYFAERLTCHAGGAKIYLKREDLAHTGAHKINNAIGQVLLAKRMGKRRVVAETGAGQHGVAAATACALLDTPCCVYMGTEDVRRQAMNVLRMRLLGAEVRPVDSGSKTLKDAINEAIRDWVTNVDTTCYVIGSAVGPHPYPMMVRDFQTVIGTEARSQMMHSERRLPDLIVACVGGGSNAIGIFYSFLDDPTKLVGVEAGGLGLPTTPGGTGPLPHGRGSEGAQHAATLCTGRVGVLHGARSYLLQDDDGQVTPTHSISAGLDYPGVGPEHAYLKDIGRVTYTHITDDEALDAFKLLSRLEGIIPALESAHAVAHAVRAAAEMPEDRIVLVNLSGRGDKDLDIVERRV